MPQSNRESSWQIFLHITAFSKQSTQRSDEIGLKYYASVFLLISEGRIRRKGRIEDDDFRPSDLQGPSVADPSCSGSLNKVTEIIKKSALLLILSIYFMFYSLTVT